MKFLLAPVILLAGLASAAPFNAEPFILKGINNTLEPGTYEHVKISDLSVREATVGNSAVVASVESVSFDINGGNATCSAQNPGTTGKVFGCSGADDKYSFGLVNGTASQFGLRIYKATGQFSGWYGVGDVPTYCRAGGGEALVCNQVAPATITIKTPGL